jgi:predicted small secreted protein
MMVGRWVSILFISVVSITLLNSCSTISGVGKDMQKAGQVIQREANKK